MTQPTNFGTSNVLGIDPTVYYIAAASVTPETPAPPFALGAQATGALGGEFIFVQASTSIALGDFIAITNALQANSLTNTNVQSSLGARIAMAATVAAQSVTLIPAGAYFWAQTRGFNCVGNGATVTVPSAGANVQLFTTATAGAITSVTTSSTLAAGLAGIECVLSGSASPKFNLTWPRAVSVYSSAGGTLSVIANA